MKRTNAIALALATVLMTTVANAAPLTRGEIQAPRGENVQTPRGEDAQAPRGQAEIQAPRGEGEQAARH
jgi:hypothetical protein